MNQKVKKVLKLLNLVRSKKIVPIITPVDKEKILDGKVALITGGSSGIGLAIAESFTKSGCKVVIAGTRKEKLEAARKTINSENLATIVIDVTDIQSLQQKVEEVANVFGKIDILVNSAGAHHTHQFEDMPEAEFDKIMDTNVKGTFYMCQSVIKYMKKNKIHGHILNVSSSSALRPATGPYHLSKWAITGLTKGLASLYYKDGIIVNAIAPGQTATPMLDVDKSEDISNGYAFAGRYIMPEEIASLATMMVSSLGDVIVGDTYYMTGGSGVVTYEG